MLRKRITLAMMMRMHNKNCFPDISKALAGCGIHNCGGGSKTIAGFKNSTEFANFARKLKANVVAKDKKKKKTKKTKMTVLPLILTANILAAKVKHLAMVLNCSQTLL